jgi:two-component system chemotaxis response regulator CheB
MRPERQDVIVIGASAGGLTPLCAILWSLPPDFPAAVFVVMHIPAWHDSLLPGIISERSRILSVHPKSGQAVEHGRIYVAPANQHLLVCRGDRIELCRGRKKTGSGLRSMCCSDLPLMLTVPAWRESF